MTKRLVEIKVLVEVESDDEVGRLTDIFENAICPHPVNSHPSRCPTRWFIVSADLSESEAADWEDLLND